MKFETKEYETKMNKSVETYQASLVTVRAGRANPNILSNVTFDYYGASTPVSQMAEIKIADARTLTVQPWDVTAVKGIEKAILASDIGITPISDGKIIRLIFPQPTEERRRELTKHVAKMGEEAKVAIRNIRRDANDKIKEMKKNSELTEDEAKLCDKNVQDLTDKYVKEIDTVSAAKNKEIMEI